MRAVTGWSLPSCVETGRGWALGPDKEGGSGPRLKLCRGGSLSARSPDAVAATSPAGVSLRGSGDTDQPKAEAYGGQHYGHLASDSHGSLHDLSPDPRAGHGKSLWDFAASRGEIFLQKPAMQIVAVHSLTQTGDAGTFGHAAHRATRSRPPPGRGRGPRRRYFQWRTPALRPGVSHCWRRRRDLNPREGITLNPLSRRAP